MNEALGRARGLMSGFTAGQRTVVIVVIIGIVAGAFALTRVLSQPNLTPLYSGLSGEDASAIVEELNSQGVQYELADGGNTILVPQGQVYDLRVTMSGQGLPANAGEGGWSLLDEQGITTTEFQQNVAYRRALEGELSKTLMAMDGVQTAVVRLAIPEKDVFTEEEDKPTAAVLLSLKPGVEFNRDQVQAVTNLVAGSVEGLDTESVTVTDSTGKMLSDDVAGGDVSGAASAADEQTALYENRMSKNVQQILDRITGPNHSAVRVNAQLDFSKRDSTSETFPVQEEETPPSSESTTTERYTGSGAGAGGTLGQTFPDLEDNAGGGNGGAYEKEERTVNNNVGKVVERVQGTPGTVERLTVAVVLDAAKAGALDPTQVQQIVANAVGLDPERGDSVQVTTLPFDTSAEEAAAKQLEAAAQAEKTAGYIDMAKQAGMWLLGLLVLFILFRRTRRKDPVIEATASDLPAEGVLIPAPVVSLEAAAAAYALPATDSALARDRVREEVAALVDSQPDDVAQMLQGWLDERKV